MNRFVPATVALGLALLTCSCKTLPSGGNWGEDAQARPGWSQMRAAVTASARDPWVWAPLALAAILQVDDFDQRASGWAREHTPVFGSGVDAERWSDDLRAACGVVEFATVIAAPSGGEPKAWLANKAKGSAVHLSAIAATTLTTGYLKDATARTRPNGADDQSFPSGHASSAAVTCRLARSNLASLGLGAGARRISAIGLNMASAGTAWARVEAGQHYPSDVLAGLALGHFFARLATDAFLAPVAGEYLSINPTEDGVILSWNIVF